MATAERKHMAKRGEGLLEKMYNYEDNNIIKTSSYQAITGLTLTIGSEGGSKHYF